MSKISDRYGLALFQVTQENNSSEEVYQGLLQSLKVFEDPEVLSYFRARDVDRQEKIKVLETNFKQFNQEILGLLKLLVKNHRFSIFPDIVKTYERIYYHHENIRIAKVTSAIELSDQQLQQLKEKLSQRYQSKIDLRLKIDPSLLQGLVIKIGDDILDNSLKSKFNQLQETLLSKGKRHGH